MEPGNLPVNGGHRQGARLLGSTGYNLTSELVLCETAAMPFEQLGLTLLQERPGEQQRCLNVKQNNGDALQASSATSSENRGAPHWHDLLENGSGGSCETWHSMFDKKMLPCSSEGESDGASLEVDSPASWKSW